VAVLTLTYDPAVELAAAEDDVADIVILKLSKLEVADVRFELSKEVMAVGNGGAEVVMLRPSIEEGEPHVPLPLLM